MIFTTWVFAAFLMASLIIYWACPAAWRKYVLIAAGAIFYAYSIPKHLLLIAGLSIAVYFIALRMVRQRNGESFFTSRRAFISGVLMCVLALFVFKYLKLAINTINQLSSYFSPGPSLPSVSLIVPLGISFFTFEFVHYLVDLYKGKIEPGTLSLTNFLCFAFFFPTLICGPIKRYQQFQKQIEEGASFELDQALEGMSRIIIGVGKKFIIADTVSQVTGVLAAPETAGWWALVIAVYAYSIKIYFDFAGYSDIAIGASFLFGVRVPENFNSPYFRRNISEFWRNWHMSLSSWIRDYLFIPLGGSRVTLARNLFNLMVVMAVCGLWHGAAWNFVVWGLWHGLGMSIHRLSKVFFGDKVILPGPVAAAVTFHFVTVGWIFFSAPSLGKSLATIHKIFFAWV